MQEKPPPTTTTLLAADLNSTSLHTPPTTQLVDKFNSLNELRILLSMEEFYRSEETRDIDRVLVQLKALKQASREFYCTQDRCEALQEAFKREDDPSAFYSLYKLQFQNLQRTILECPLNDTALHASPLGSLPQKGANLITRFISILRTSPTVIAGAFTNLPSEELYDLIRVNPCALKPTSIPDILLYAIFDPNSFIEEQRLCQALWKSIFVSLIKEKKGDAFMMEALERYVRLYSWSPKGSLETCLMKLLRHGEDALKLLDEEDPVRRRSFSKTHSFSASMIHLQPSGNPGSAAPYHHANASEVDRFLDSACIELLGILHHCVPASLINLTRAILQDLPPKLHHYATIQIMVKFFFYRFIGKLICYPEFFGLCEDHYISERRRQKILFSIHQRLYRHITTITSPVPGWRSLNIDARIRALVERIVALFVLPPSDGLALADAHGRASRRNKADRLDVGQPPVLPGRFSPAPFPRAFPAVTPTVLISSEDIIELHEFLSSHCEPVKGAYNPLADVLFELIPVVRLLKGQEVCSALLHVKAGKDGVNAGDLTPSFLTLDFMSPTGDLDGGYPTRRGSTRLERQFSRRLKITCESVRETIQLAAQSARFYNHLDDVACFQKALRLLDELPDELTRDSYAGLIRWLALDVERARAVREMRSRERQVWLAYLQEFEGQLRLSSTRLEGRCSSLRLHVFYTHFRGTKAYKKRRASLLELVGRSHLDEGELAQVESYLQTGKVCDFVPGDERFHLFCLRIQALGCSAMANLWACDGYSQEHRLFRSRPSVHSLSPPSSGASSLRSARFTAHAPAAESHDRDPLAERGLAFANHAPSDFPSVIQLRLVDGWFTELVGDFDPPEVEAKPSAVRVPRLSLAQASEKSGIGCTESPTHSLSSGSHSPTSDSSASTTSVAIPPPPAALPPSLRLLFSLELLIVANMPASDKPGTDSIIDEIERVFRRIRPRHLFRDLQLVAAFVPSGVLDLTDVGKAFCDFSLASLSLKKEAVDRAVSKGASLIEAMTRRPSAGALLSSDQPDLDQSDLLERRQQFEALRLFALAAKEGHVEAQRELAILYLSLPSLPAGPPSPSPASFLGALYNGANPSGAPSRGSGGDKYDPANVASALYWFERAAAQGDAFSIQYLTHRGGAFSLPPNTYPAGGRQTAPTPPCIARSRPPFRDDPFPRAYAGAEDVLAELRAEVLRLRSGRACGRDYVY
ncbi:hypothetical protein L0F63_005829 [Massospora cicadina]|nr:hypothetical protein L0F63_005829 [Massospora cicadina]